MMQAQTDYSNPEPQGEERENRPLNPVWLLPVSLLTGPAVTGPMAGAILFRAGSRAAGIITGILTSIAGLVSIALLFLWPVNWIWSALALVSFNALSGTVLFFAVRPAFRRSLISPRPQGERGGHRAVLAGIAGGGGLAFIFGFASLVAYLLVVDHFFSTIIPVAYADTFATFRLSFSAFWIGLSGAVAGAFVGRFRPRLTPWGMLFCAAVLLTAHLLWVFAIEVLVAVPSFRAGAAVDGGWSGMTAPFVFGDVMIGSWWPILLLFYVVQAGRTRTRFFRVGQLVFINFLAACTLIVYFGYASDVYLALGQRFERKAEVPNALWCYHLGLTKKPDDQAASWLQYRLALLNHKLGREEMAREGFSRVVARYNANQELSEKAARFLENMERNPKGKRVVLPGVETRTEYKSAYCVPNSLALAMRYFGSKVTAREIGESITGLSTGTFAVNQAWFAQDRGFFHDFIPMSTLEDIKTCIDKGFPVLVYVPQHVFAIFGYDDSLETLVTYDVATSEVWVEYLERDFVKAWKKQASTLILVYPPEEEGKVPPEIRKRAARLSPSYLHYQLYFLDSPEDEISFQQLMASAGKEGEFFLSVILAYAAFPHERKALDERYGPEAMAGRIRSFYWDDFDEGVHLAGQYHREDYSMEDDIFGESLAYLVGHGDFALLEELVGRIDYMGQVSETSLAIAAMADLSAGRIERGLDRLERADEGSPGFYKGLARLSLSDESAAVRDFAGILENASYGPYISGDFRDLAGNNLESRLLDAFGYPAEGLANQILLSRTQFGQSRETVEEAWQNWTHERTYDAATAAALEKLVDARIGNTNPHKNPSLLRRLEKKRALCQDRVEAYRLESFLPATPKTRNKGK